MTDTERKQRDEQDASQKRWITSPEIPVLPFGVSTITEFEDCWRQLLTSLRVPKPLSWEGD